MMHLKAARVNAGLTQVEACKQLGIAVPTLSKWENGKTFPSAVKLKALCTLYHCKLDDIFLPDILHLK